MFARILDASLRNRVLVLAAALVLVVWGTWQTLRTPVDVFPDLNKPTVTLMTEAGGMAPEEVEQLIAFPLESAMNGLPGVETVRSVSAAGLSIVYVTFGWRELFVPNASEWKPGPVTWGLLAFYVMLVIQLTSWAMKKLPKWLWRGVHLLAYPAFVMATVHRFHPF